MVAFTLSTLPLLALGALAGPLNIEDGYLNRRATALSCPASNSTVYTSSNSKNFVVQINHAGGDLGWSYQSTLEACINSCATTTGCVAVSWNHGNPGQCYIKSTLNAASTNANVWGAVLSTSLTSTAAGHVASSTTTTAATTTSATKAASATPYAPQPTNAKGPGALPVKLASTQYLGQQLAYYTDGTLCEAARDLGYSGAMDGNILWTFGDTLVHNADGSYTFDGYNSAALGNTSNYDVMTYEYRYGYGNYGPIDWIPLTANESAQPNTIWGEGGTNIVQTSPGVGFVYYQQANRSTGSTGIQGCGVADVHMTLNGSYSSTRTEDKIFSQNEMCWGQDGAAYNAADGYLYSYTPGPNYETYVARVLPANAHNAASYQAYNASSNTWISGANRFTTAGLTVPGFPNAIAIDTTWSMIGVGWGGMSQSAPFWSAYYNVWMWVHGDVWGYSNIFILTSPEPYGPWTDAGINVDTSIACPNGDCTSGYRYAHMGHPEYDATGKTLLVSWCWKNLIFLYTFSFA